MADPKIGRNEPCPCGSGKKYKRCCLLTQPPPTVRSELLAPETAPAATPATLGPEAWKTLAGGLPGGQGQPFAARRAGLWLAAEVVHRHPEIAAAEEALEAHRAVYEALCQDQEALMAQAQRLFAEETFADLRYRAADLQRAFAEVGFISDDTSPQQFSATAKRAIDFLTDQDQRETLANRLVLLLPDYVRAGRITDAWIIQHSIAVLVEPGAAVQGPFLMAIFLQALDEWRREQEQNNEAMIAELGLDPARIRKLGYRGIKKVVQDIVAQPEKMAALEAVLAKRPELGQMLQSMCADHEQAAVDLLFRDDATDLLLSKEEVAPWLSVLVDRVANQPVLAKHHAGGPPPDKAAKALFNETLVEVGREMAVAMLTPERQDRLADQINAYRQRLPAAERERCLVAIYGALVATASRDPAPQDSRFLLALCCLSLARAGQAS